MTAKNELQKLILEFPKKGWNWISLSKNPNIDWEFVEANQQFPWDYGYMAENPNISIKIIITNPDKEWGYYKLLRNPSITWEDILHHSYIFGKTDLHIWRLFII